MDLFDAPFYWGRITRQDAEDVIDQLGLKNGLYLVREKYEEAGSYAITLCYSKRFYHYRIDRLPNDNVVLNGSRAQETIALSTEDSNSSGRRRSARNSDQMEFSGPIELITYFQTNADLLVTTLSIPCNRPNNFNFIAFWCVPLLTPELYQRKIFHEAYNADQDIPSKDKLSVKRYIYERQVLKALHEDQLWFHPRTNRQEAEHRLRNAGAKNGLFLIRENTSDKRSRGSYSLSLYYQLTYHHYIIEQTSNGRLQIASANKSANFTQFGSIVQLVDFYHRYAQDLACCLKYKCKRPGGSVRIRNFLDDNDSLTEESGNSGTDIWSPKSISSTGSTVTSPFDFAQSPRTFELGNSNDLSLSESFFIDEKYLIVGDRLGEGQFGEVFNGKLIRHLENINEPEQTSQQVAIKRIRQRQTSLVQELLNEGQRMLRLDHRNIVKIFGLTKHDNSISLVLELCPFGAMNEWLKSNKTFRMKYILNYMYQVSDGMNYLHEKNIIHRDLALRNILIMSKNICKISDFGLSRVVEENTYYQIVHNRRLPSIWYPPEVLETTLFHSQIDIWSFGITVWEATSYGQTPYKFELETLKSLTFEPVSQRLLKFLRDGHRLKQPSNCPNEIYDLMLKCWEYNKRDRPTFAWIKQYLSKYAIDQDS